MPDNDLVSELKILTKPVAIEITHEEEFCVAATRRGRCHCKQSAIGLVPASWTVGSGQRFC